MKTTKLTKSLVLSTALVCGLALASKANADEQTQATPEQTQQVASVQSTANDNTASTDKATSNTGETLTAENVEQAKNLIYDKEENAQADVQAETYIKPEAVEKVDEEESGNVLETHNTANYTADDETSTNPYSSDEATTVKQSVGETVTVNYTNIENSSYNDTKVARIEKDYTLDSSSNGESAIVTYYNDPTQGYFAGAETTSDHNLAMTITTTFYDADDNIIDLTGSLWGVSSLNHWTKYNSNHIEAVQLDGNQAVYIDGSSITDQNGTLFSINDNQYIENGSLFNADGADGWDQMTADGEAVNETAFWGAGAFIATSPSVTITVTVGGNADDIPTGIWFKMNNNVITKPEGFVMPTPDDETNNTDENSETPKTNDAEKPKQENNVKINSKVSNSPSKSFKTYQGTNTPTYQNTALKTQNTDDLENAQAELPHTGDTKQSLVATIVAIILVIVAAFTAIAVGTKKNK